MHKNFISSSTNNQKISPFDRAEVEIFKFLIAMLFMGHPVYKRGILSARDRLVASQLRPKMNNPISTTVVAIWNTEIYVDLIFNAFPNCDHCCTNWLNFWSQLGDSRK